MRRKPITASPWLFHGKPFTTVPDDATGFVYLITNTVTGRQYIGRKQFHSTRTKKVTGKRRRVKTVSESDWQSYFGSCEELKTDVAALGAQHFKREILRLCKNKRELGYWETAYQFKYDVLFARLPNGSRSFYNCNIMSRWFAEES